MKNIKKYNEFKPINEGSFDKRSNVRASFDWEEYDPKNPELFFMGEKDKILILRHFKTDNPSNLVMLHSHEGSKEESFIMNHTNSKVPEIHEDNSEYHNVYHFHAYDTEGDELLFLKVTSTAPVYNKEYKAYMRK